MTGFPGFRPHLPVSAPDLPPEEPRDYVVVLTFGNGRRDPSSASAMTLEDAEAEAAHWRGMRPEPARLGAALAPSSPPTSAEVCRLVKVR